MTCDSYLPPFRRAAVTRPLLWPGHGPRKVESSGGARHESSLRHDQEAGVKLGLRRPRRLWTTICSLKLETCYHILSNNSTCLAPFVSFSSYLPLNNSDFRDDPREKVPNPLLTWPGASSNHDKSAPRWPTNRRSWSIHPRVSLTRHRFSCKNSHQQLPCPKPQAFALAAAFGEAFALAFALAFPLGFALALPSQKNARFCAVSGVRSMLGQHGTNISARTLQGHQDPTVHQWFDLESASHALEPRPLLAKPLLARPAPRTVTLESSCP